MREFNAFEAKNVRFLVNKQVAYATIQITETGFKKSILDATAPVRTYFIEKGIHDYEDQPQGPEHKKYVDTFILTDLEQHKTSVISAKDIFTWAVMAAIALWGVLK